MAFLIVEIEFPRLSVADISDRTGFKGNEQDDLNGAVNLMMACAAGTQLCNHIISITNNNNIGCKKIY